jgi:uncharacterized protein (DUF488 family)
MNKIFTIGFTKKTAETFFTTICKNNISLLIDVRLNNTSQLAGFTKENDLRYFLKAIGDISYLHEPLLAPTSDILKDYKNQIMDWANYERKFKDLLKTRKIEQIFYKVNIKMSCLLCSEQTADKCHRRLVAEYLKETIGDLEIIHL